MRTGRALWVVAALLVGCTNDYDDFSFAPDDASAGGSAGIGGGTTGGSGGTGATGGTGGATGGTGGATGLDCSTFPNNAQSFTVQGQTHCYWAVTTAANYATATTACETAGGYLVTIHSAQENTFARALTTGEPWIGLRRTIPSGPCNAGAYSWVTNEPTPYTNWVPGQPNCGGGGGAQGVRFAASGAWEDSGASNTRPYICEAGPLFN